ncbi:MAG: ABC transporter substrate-binding protein [Gammaproteobacteria bacterium]|nr:MAG: ABC transporter substrate-binding protein [Gammaproteobacteria bacterium]
MKHGVILMLALVAGLYSIAASAAGHKPAEISVGYVLQWPTPAQFAQVKKTFDDELGLRVNWVPFASGNDMNAAMARQDLQIGYAQDHVPFLVGVSQGLDLTVVGIAVSYPGNDNCIVRDGIGISRDNAASLLAGKKIALQVGSLSHYRLLRMLDHLGVDRARIEIVASADDTATARSLQLGEVVMACASGGALRAIETLGKPLMSGDEQEKIGLRLFDTISVTNTFLETHPEIVQAFMDVVEATNQQWRKNPEPMRAAIARAAQMSQGASDRRLTGFRFPTVEEQKSDSWMGQVVPAYSKQLADFFVAEGKLDKSLDSYDQFFSTEFLR